MPWYTLVPALVATLITPPLLAAARRLRWVQSPTASLEHYLFPELTAHSCVLTNMRGLFSDVIADHVFGYIICFARNFHRYIRQQMMARWEPVGDVQHDLLRFFNLRLHDVPELIRTVRFREDVDVSGVTAHPPGTEADFPDQDVCHDSDERDEEDDRQPGQADRGMFLAAPVFRYGSGFSARSP